MERTKKPLGETDDLFSTDPLVIAANELHDRRYGWEYRLSNVYTNPLRRPEAESACPLLLRARAADAEEERQIIWDWHNRNRNGEAS